MSGLEVIGIVASIIQVADLGAKLSVKLCSLCHTVKTANQSMRSLSSDVALTCSVLHELGKTLEQDSWTKLYSERAMFTAKAVLGECESVFQRIDNAIEKQNQASEKTRFLRGAKKLTNTFLGRDLELLKSNLERLKSTMLLMLNVIIYAGQIRQGSAKSTLDDQRDLIEALLEKKRETEASLDHLNKKIQDARLSPDETINQKSSKAMGSQEDHCTVPGELQQYFSLMRALLAEIDAYQHNLDQTRHIRIRNGVVGIHSAEAMLFQNFHGRIASQLFNDSFFNFREAPIADTRDTPIVNDNESFDLHQVRRDSDFDKKVKMPTPPETKSSLRPPPSAAAAGLRAPRSQGGSRLSSSTLARAPMALHKTASASRKVILDAGYSPLDWAALSANLNSQRLDEGVPPGQLCVTPSMLKVQNGRKGRDAWTSYQGKVYNVTPYLPYHPGGKEELLRGAGIDSEHLFHEIHPWVNWGGILGECLVGILVSEDEVQTPNSPAPDEGQEDLGDRINDRPGQLDSSEAGFSEGVQKEPTKKEMPSSGQLEKHSAFQRHEELMQKKEPAGKSPLEGYFDGAGDNVRNGSNAKTAAQWVLEWTTLTVEEMQIAI